jgi:predicted nuclease with TOPRIM domain
MCKTIQLTGKSMFMIMIGLEEKLNELQPLKREQYFDLQSENQELMKSIGKLEAELEELARASHSMESELATNNIKQRALALTEQIRGLQERKYELESEESKQLVRPCASILYSLNSSKDELFPLG